MDYRLLILTLGTFAIGTDNYVVAGILPQVAQSFNVSVAAAAQFITVYALAYGISTPIMATLTANWPRRRVFLVGLVIFVVGNILTATQQTFDFALLSRAIAGLGGAMATPAAGAAAAAMVSLKWRGRALAIVLAGLSGATAMGAPIGTLISNFGDWRTTMWFVAALGILTSLGALVIMPALPTSSQLRLWDRLAPLGDARVATTLATTLLTMFGIFLVYTYISVVFDRATGGDGKLLAALLSIWGIGATFGILGAGSLVDRFGSRPVINAAIVIVACDFALIHWTSAHFISAVVALVLWGMCGWSLVVTQQHRLVGIMPTLAPIVIALNASAIYIGVSASGAIGGLAIKLIDPHNLPFFSTSLILSGAFTAELAQRFIQKAKMKEADL